MTLPQIVAVVEILSGEGPKDQTDAFVDMCKNFASHTGKNKFNVKDII